LAVTVVVQILVIPRVQRRTRAFERWEDNVTELVTAVNEEWPEKLDTLNSAGISSVGEARVLAECCGSGAWMSVYNSASMIWIARFSCSA